MNNDILLVLGASSEVGSELIRVVEKNYDIVLAHYCHTKESLDLLKKEMGNRLVLLQADFSDKDDTQKLIDQVNSMGVIPTHIVHFSALKSKNIKFAKSTLKDYSEEIQISVLSFVQILQAFLPKMAKNRTGKVIFMLTAYTIHIPPKFLAPYITAKYALLGLMKALSAEYADKGISINAVSPEMVETKFLSEIPELIVQQNAANNPMGRNLMVCDVVPTFEFLLSHVSDGIKGQNIAITGGK